MFLMALQWGGTEYPWNSATIIGLFCGAGGTLVVFTACEYRAGDGAMIPFSMIRNRVVWSSCLVIGFFFGPLLVFTYYLPIYFQAVKGVSPALSGVYILPGVLSQILMEIVSGVLGKYSFFIYRHVADMADSWEIGILSAMECGQCSVSCHCLWFDLDFYSTYFDCKVGWLSVSCWYWPWLWFANGNILLISNRSLTFSVSLLINFIAYHCHPKLPFTRTKSCWDVTRCVFPNIRRDYVSHLCANDI